MSYDTLQIVQEREHELALTWAGKRGTLQVEVPDLHRVEAWGHREDPQVGPSDTQAPPYNGMLLHGDNQAILAWLLHHGYAGRVHLVYLDPPFDSDNNYTSAVRLRGDGAVVGQRVQYTDRWQGTAYLQFMLDRLLLLRELMDPDGTLWLHCDHRANASLFLLLEEVFGPKSYLNTISWRSQVARGAKVHARYFPRSTHYLHIFARSPRGTQPGMRPAGRL